MDQDLKRTGKSGTVTRRGAARAGVMHAAGMQTAPVHAGVMHAAGMLAAVRRTAAARHICLLLAGAMAAAFLTGCAPESPKETSEAAESGPVHPTFYVPQSEAEPDAGAGSAEPDVPETEPANGIFGENSDLLSDEQKQAVCAYMDRFYDTVGSLRMTDISDLFEDSAAGQLAFHENTWEYLIELRSMQQSDLRLHDYRYDLWVLETEELEDGSIRADLGERCVLNFAQTPETDSVYPGIWHTFVLAESGGTVKIRSHVQWDGVFWNMIKGYQDQDLEELADADAIFENRKEQLLREIRDDLERRAAPAMGAGSGEDPDAKAGSGGDSNNEAGSGENPDNGKVSGKDQENAAAHPYDAAAAIAYARRYAGYRNEEWHDYSGEGGNCQNYVSQCLIAGGIPMDTEGPARWKWYSDGVNNSAEELGCTMSWINVDSFYEYARDNEGAGLAAEVDADFGSGRPGDLIMMGTPADWNHMVIISDVVKDASGRTIDYLICSNTSEVKDFPASAYPSPCRALIRIMGWN